MGFWKFFQREVKQIPAKGESWLLNSSPDPWGGKTHTPVTILDVKDGWVRYKFSDHIFTDERMELGTFTDIYSKV